MSATLPSVALDVAGSSGLVGDDNPITLRTEVSAVTHSSAAADDVVVVDVNNIISSLLEAITSLEKTAQSVTFLGDMAAEPVPGSVSRPSSSGQIPTADPPTISVNASSTPRGNMIDTAAGSNTNGASWFVDAILSNGLKDQEIRSAVVLIRKAVESLSTAARLNSTSGSARQLLVAPTLGGSGGKLGVPSAQSTSAAGSARGMTRFDEVPALLGGLSPNAPSRSASVRGGADSGVGSFLGSTTRIRQGQQRAFADVDDIDLAQWLNENYSQAPKRATNGFEVQLDGGPEISMNTNLEPSDEFLADEDNAPPLRHNTDAVLQTVLPLVAASDATLPGAEGEVSEAPTSPLVASPLPVKQQEHQPPSARAASVPNKDSQGGAASPAKKQGSVSAPTAGATAEGAGTKYTRSTQRSFPAASSHKRTLELLELMDCPYLADVDSPEFDVFSAHETHGSNLLVYVAGNIFSRYNFVRSLQLDVPTLRIFFETVRLFYRDVNPYHNTIHASDVLQSTHVYLCVGNVKENFSDVELFAVLFAALVHDVGHLGIANAFLIKIRHPLARLYNDISPLENSHAALAFALLERPECNFFTSSTTFNRRLFDDFRSLVIEALHGTDMRLHADQTKSVEGILEDGVIEDHEVGKLLKAILHAADLSNPMKPLSIYLKWVDRVMAEFWQQGDEEKRRGMPISILCDRNGTNVAKSQMGFISFVVKPFVKELAPVLPKVWLERLDSNWAALQQLTPEVEVERVAQISFFASKPWVDVDEEVHPSCVQVLCGEVCTSISDEKLLQPNEFVASIEANHVRVAEAAASAAAAADAESRWSMIAHRESVAATETDAATTADDSPREGSFESSTIPPGILGGADSSQSEGDLTNQQQRSHSRNPSTGGDIVKARLLLPSGKKEPRAHLGHHQGSSRLMSVDVDADSTSFHVDTIRKLTSLASEAFANPTSTTEAEKNAKKWLCLLCELEHDRLHLREQLIERCQRGERRPAVLLVGNGSLRDDATDASRFSVFSCAPDAAVDALLKAIQQKQENHKATTDEGNSTSLRISTSYCGPLAKRIQLLELLKSSSTDAIQNLLSATTTSASVTATKQQQHAALNILALFQATSVDPTTGASEAAAVASPMSTMSNSGGGFKKRNNNKNTASRKKSFSKQLLLTQRLAPLRRRRSHPQMSTMSNSGGGFNGKRKRVLSLIAEASVSLEEDMSGRGGGVGDLKSPPMKTPLVSTSDRNADIFSSLGVLTTLMTQLLMHQWRHHDAAHGRPHSKGVSQLPPITHHTNQHNASSSSSRATHGKLNASAYPATGTYLARTALNGWNHNSTATNTNRSASALDYSSVSEPTVSGGGGGAGNHKAVELYAMRTRTLLPRSFLDNGVDDERRDESSSFRRGLPSVWMRELKSRSPENSVLGDI
ncbi:phosphodiesterase, putative [Bodo saltans]|uniref:Phosphodiesterase n=1 Tax=Bodo saltans TaxID=75058 RepID=A0A0S4JR28_BODSA|nr:phosphodiesterase, putative [Bodo saltans]|eukprot:CUG92692.1 phosphodiesterase, putative [Bodo saltans]